jgi:hypothetical protein
MIQNSTADRPVVSNPFQVYPVQPLSALLDVRAATVETPEIKTVRDAVVEFAKTFDLFNPQPPRHLVMAVKGDFGTGKTHLMMYALALLEGEVGNLRRRTTRSAESQDGSSKISRSVLAVANEASIEDWYSSVLGPELIKSVRPRDLVRELMVMVACEVADQNEKTRYLSSSFRESPQEMFEILRSSDAIDGSKVEQLFLNRLAQLADAEDDCLRCLAALRWTETASLAERWLTCLPLDEDDIRRLGLSNAGDRALRASAFIASTASICRALNRPFALFIDEFEHLARHDGRNMSRRNVTWLKRLIEALSRRNAMVFVSGHWKAWEQQGDFLDRFTGRPALQLVRLDTGDIISIVKVIAPEWAPYFLSDAASTLADVTSGNIRRVMTILYDLYAKTGKSEEPVTPKMVSATAAQRLHRAPEEGFLGTIEQTVRAKGGVLERDAIVFGERFDGVVRLDGVPRLVIKVLHARDESALLAEGEKLADEVRTIRRTMPKVRGLFIAVGAVNPEHLRTLDAARTEVDVVDGENSDIGPKVSGLVAAALAEDSELHQPNADFERIREELRQLRVQVLDRSSDQAARAEIQFGNDERAMAVRESISPAPDDIARQKADIDRRATIDKILADEQRFDPLPYLGLLRNLFFMAPLGFGVATLLFGTDLLQAVVRYPTNSPIYLQFQLMVRLFGYSQLIVAAFVLFQNIMALMHLRKIRLETLENVVEEGADPVDLRRLRMAMTQDTEMIGPRRASAKIEARLQDMRDQP